MSGRRNKQLLAAGCVLAFAVVSFCIPASAQQQSAGKYFNADGTKTDDLEAAAASWRTPEFLKNHALAGVKAEYAYAYGFTGQGMKIGMVDSGVYDGHPQLQGQFTALTVKGTYGADGYRYEGVPGWKQGDTFSVPGNYDPLINDSHGTAAAGEMIAKRDGLEMHGIAFDAQLYSANTGGNDGTVFGPGVDYIYFKEAYGILARNGARVINSSWGQEASNAGDYGTLGGAIRLYGLFEGKKTFLDAAAEVSQEYQTIQVWANGNEGRNNPRAAAALPWFRPEIEQYWIAVTGVMEDKRSVYDRCGITKYWCMAGPTVSIYTTAVDDLNTFGGEWSADNIKASYLPYYSGTSAAAPNVTAALALVMQRFPYLTNSQARDVLFTTAEHLSDDTVKDDNPDAPNEVFGWGRPDLKKAMEGPGQFLGRFVANMSAGVSDIWRNDISDAALKQRQTEERASIAGWEQRKRELQAQVRPVPDPGQRTAELLADLDRAKQLLQAAIDGNAAVPGTYSPPKQNSALDAIKADPNGAILLALYSADNPGWEDWSTFPGDLDKFLAKRSNAELVSAMIDYERETILAINKMTPDTIKVEGRHVAYLSTKTEADYLGGLTKSGAGKLTLLGQNSYRGETIVDGGELVIGKGGSVTSASLVNTGGLLSVDGTAAAATVNTGGWLKVNASGVTGDLTLKGGTARVNGRSGTALVDGGGLLGGDGTLAGLNVKGGGTVAPGNSIGTLTISGDASFDKASTLAVEVAADGRSDLLAVGGKTTLLGGVVVVSLEGAAAPLSPGETLALLGKSYTILTSAGGVSGSFDSVVPNFYFIGAELSYDPKAVKVSLSRNDVAFASVGRTRNQKAVAEAIEGLGLGNALYDMTATTSLAADLPARFAALSGTVHASLQGMLIDDSQALRDAAAGRIRTAFAQPELEEGSAGDAVAGQAMWAQAYGAWASVESDGNAAAYERNRSGLVGGIDGQPADDWLLGLLVGYGSSSLDMAAASVSVDTFQLGLYGSTQRDALGLRFGASYSRSAIETERAVLGATAKADYDAGAFQLFGEAGYEFKAGQAIVEPLAGLAYTRLETDDFQETQAGIYNLSGAGSTSDVTTSLLGVRGSYAFAFGQVAARANGFIGWQHAFGDTQTQTELRFAGGELFTNRGLPIAEDAFVLEAGMDADFAPNARLGLTYNGRFASGVEENAVKADFTLKF